MTPPATSLSEKRRAILEFIDQQIRDRGFPPSVREIGKAVNLTSSSSVHAHLNTLERLGFISRHPTLPRAMEVRWHPGGDTALERRPTRHVPLVGDVAAGTDVLADENLEEILPMPQDFTGEGQLFMLRVRGDSMIEAGILDGDYVVVCKEPDSAKNGDIVVAGIPGDEATVKTYKRRGNQVTLEPSNASFEPMTFPAADVTIYGRVVTQMRRY